MLLVVLVVLVSHKLSHRGHQLSLSSHQLLHHGFVVVFLVIVVVAMGSVAASSMVIISTMVIIPSVMTISSMMTVVVMRGMLLERGLRMVFVDSKPPLPFLCLLHAILQYDSLVHQGLVIGSVGNGQRDLKFII